MSLTRADLFARIQGLPPVERDEALDLAIALYESQVPTGARREPDHRRSFNGDPWKYFRDVYGWTLTPQQERCLAMVEEHDRVLIASGNNLGKTWLLSGYGGYRMDAVAAMPDEANGLEEQGGRVLLPGPDHATIFSTVYAAMLAHAEAAERRGYLMPGYRSIRSVLWRVRPGWEVEAFAPPRTARRGEKSDKRIQHSVSGRHHANQVALIEEGAGVDETVWVGVEGMCSGHGNKIVSSFQPSESAGPAYTRAERGSWHVIHLSAFDHPNVRGRAVVVGGGSVSYLVIDGKVRDQATDRGPYPGTPVEPSHRDFVYALAPKGATESGPRKDGHLGHPDGALRVYRPGPLFEAQVLGVWPSTTDDRLFSRPAIEAAMDRGRARHPPEGPPDRVGVDVAREGGDEPCAAPAWGDNAEAILRGYAEAKEIGPDDLALFLELPRLYVGPIITLPKGDGPTVAEAVVRHFPASPFQVDEGGVGASVLDHLGRVIRVQAVGVSFGAAPPTPTPGEPWSENLRTAMYVRAAMLVNLGLVDLPDDPPLKEELLAHELLHRFRVVEAVDPQTRAVKKERKPSVLLIDKDTVKARIGRSPDHADAFVLAVNERAAKRTRAAFA